MSQTLDRNLRGMGMWQMDIRPLLGQYSKIGASSKRILSEFQVTPDALLPVDTTILASHFLPGQYVDVMSKS